MISTSRTLRVMMVVTMLFAIVSTFITSRLLIIEQSVSRRVDITDDSNENGNKNKNDTSESTRNDNDNDHKGNEAKEASFQFQYDNAVTKFSLPDWMEDFFKGQPIATHNDTLADPNEKFIVLTCHKVRMCSMEY